MMLGEEQILQIWEVRYRKVLKLELEALKHYQKLLKKYSHILDGSRMKQMIRNIMKDEIHHVEIAKKLLDIVKERKQQLIHARKQRKIAC
jgi:rubrerythrin